MADSNVAITAGSGTLIDTQVPTGGDHRQVVVLGDPATVANVANISSTGSVQVAGAGASGSALVGNPILTAGSDGTNARNILTDTSGRLIVVPPDTSAAISIAANATSSGSITSLTGSGVAMIQLTGTFTATVQVQLTTDGTNYVNVTGSNSITNAATGAYLASGNLTATGMYMVDVSGATGVRVITTAYTSGTVTGTVRVVPGVGGSTAVSGVPLVAQSGTWTVGVTGYPTAAASADALANPTVTQIGSAGLVFNGTSWDRVREATADGAAATGLVAAADVAYNGATWDRVRSGTFTLNVDTSSARTATGNGTAAVNYAGHKNLTVWINVTAVSGTTPTCVFKLQWSPDNGTTWIDWDTTNLQTTSISTVSTALLKVGVNATTAANASKQDYLPRQIRLVWTIGGTTPSFTFASWYTFTG